MRQQKRSQTNKLLLKPLLYITSAQAITMHNKSSPSGLLLLCMQNLRGLKAKPLLFLLVSYIQVIRKVVKVILNLFHKGRHDEIERIKKDPGYLRVILEKERSEKQE